MTGNSGREAGSHSGRVGLYTYNKPCDDSTINFLTGVFLQYYRELVSDRTRGGSGSCWYDDSRAGPGKKSSLSPIRDPNATIIGVVTISHNITEQKRAETALRESEEKYRTIAKTSD